MITPTLLRDYRDRFSDFQLVTVDGVGHWIVEERPELVLDRLRPVLQDYAGALDAEGAFTGLSWSDAKNIAAAVAFDLTQRDDAQEFIAQRARTVLGGRRHDVGRPAGCGAGVEHRGHGARAVR